MLKRFPPEIQRFMDLTYQINALMEQEIDYMRNHDNEKMEASQKRKDKLTGQYAVQMRLLDQKPELIRSLSRDAKDEFIAATRSLQSSAERNAQTIKSAYDTGQKIMMVMLEVAKQNNRNVDAYSGSGTMMPQFNKVYGHSPTPLTMDQRL